ncbi:hypothetical protein WJX84_010565 [Apatococcus fuscideae]|uniref:Uncharacterized protein n=1 Tax=Apatococcus fuscideae TaxID=2026836 RepID=A0AAW1SQW4_9CHLO
MSLPGHPRLLDLGGRQLRRTSRPSVPSTCKVSRQSIAGTGLGQRCLKAGAAISDLTFGRYGLILETDGILVDTQQQCHRRAFNKAFEQAGLQTVHWEPSMYHDLLRSGNGTPEGIIISYFNTVGWPKHIKGWNEGRRQLLKQLLLLKDKALNDMVKLQDFPLRTGVEKLLDQALADGAAVAVLSGTASAPEEHISEAAVAQLGEHRTLRLHAFTCSGFGGPQQEEDSPAGGLPEEPSWPSDTSKDLNDNIQDAVARARAQAKVNEALEFVQRMQGGQWGGAENTAGIYVDPTILAAAQRAGRMLRPSFLEACLTTMNVPAKRCAVVAANHTTMQALQGMGMLVAAVPASLSKRGRFTSADMKYDGFGPGGGVTWSRLKASLSRRALP